MVEQCPKISIIIPVLNEGGILLPMLQSFQWMRQQGCELILVDGGSNYFPEAQLASLCDRVLVTGAGRALQMNHGARAAKSDLLWFLHLDSQLPRSGVDLVYQYARQGRWGRFDIQLSGSPRLLRVVECLINLRSRVTGIATGDQGLFMPLALYERVGGFPNIVLMEDVAICRRLKRIGQPVNLRQRLETSSRRWERNGIIRTILLMWWLRLAFSLGADPARLAKIYRPCSSPIAES
ncbi:MAG: TIGR04283 family arsenosugar biosynthesis glycosyltransferase [Candidatus Polarisedimenticolaceae bacterium]|nr:TIGR04283 family arsenosugar biosynthesis glycosyltransferase [Candidatus Polarisedimenticolaceae bacterium]